MMKKVFLILMLGLFFIRPAFAEAVPPQNPEQAEEARAFDPFPGNRGSNYEYDRDDIPDICFFPADKARWDGNQVMAADWFKLTDFQKAMFISEYVAVLEKRYGKPFDLEGGWGYLGMMNQSIATLCQEDPETCADARATVTFDAILLAKGMRELMSPASESLLE